MGRAFVFGFENFSNLRSATGKTNTFWHAFSKSLALLRNFCLAFEGLGCIFHNKNVSNLSIAIHHDSPTIADMD